MNFSARSVIVPDPDLKADEIKISYLCFLELYKYEIIAHICKLKDITENEAYDEWFRASLCFSNEVYQIMQYLIKKRKTHVLINRNPTINFGSLLSMKIVDIKKDFKDDYTMSLPIQILRVLNAD